MFQPKIAKDFAKQFVDSLPPGLHTISQEIETQLSRFLQDCFSKMALVTREEFDVQTQVLAKTRLKLEHLETELQRLTTQFECLSQTTSGKKEHV